MNPKDNVLQVAKELDLNRFDLEDALIAWREIVDGERAKFLSGGNHDQLGLNFGWPEGTTQDPLMQQGIRACYIITYREECVRKLDRLSWAVHIATFALQQPENRQREIQYFARLMPKVKDLLSCREAAGRRPTGSHLSDSSMSTAAVIQ